MIFIGSIPDITSKNPQSCPFITITNSLLFRRPFLLFSTHQLTVFESTTAMGGKEAVAAIYLAMMVVFSPSMWCLQAEVENLGITCWDECKGVDGPCSYCGSKGYCCRKNVVGNGCNGDDGTDTNHHRCVERPSHVSEKSTTYSVSKL